jgi:uncharacterized protein with FMN-binding domain
VVIIERFAESDYFTALEDGPTPLSNSPYKDGTYIGTGAGYGGTVTLSVTLLDGEITAITVVSHSETEPYWSRAKGLIDKILTAQGTDGVDSVTGATLSCNAVLTAVKDALGQALGNAAAGTSGALGGGGGSAGALAKVKKLNYDEYYLADGEYSGSATGYRSTVTVKVAVSGGEIWSVTATHNEDPGYISKTRIDTLFGQIVGGNTTAAVDTVSGATYSFNAFLAAVEAALDSAIIAKKTELSSLEAVGDSGILTAAALTAENLTTTKIAEYKARVLAGAEVDETKLTVLSGYNIEGTAEAGGLLLLLPIEHYDSEMNYTVYHISGNTAEALDTRVFYKEGGYYAAFTATSFSPFLLVITEKELEDAGPVYKVDTAKVTKGGVITVTVKKADDKDRSIETDYTVELVPSAVTGGTDKILASLSFDETTYKDEGGAVPKQIANHEYVEQVVDRLNARLLQILSGKNPTADAASGATVSYSAIEKALIAADYVFPVTANPDVLAVVPPAPPAAKEISVSVSILSSALVLDASEDLYGAVVKVTQNGAVTDKFTVEALGKTYVLDGTYSGEYTVKLTLPGFAAERTVTASAGAYLYGVMNIPYVDFFANEGGGTVQGVDAVTMASNSKWNSASMVNKSYSSAARDQYGAILGVTYPIAITPADYAALTAKTNELRHGLNPVSVYDIDAKSYTKPFVDEFSYTVTALTTEKPATYKAVSFNGAGDMIFSEVREAETYVIDADAYPDIKLLAGGETTYGDFEIDFTKLNNNSFPVSGSGYAGTGNDGSQKGIKLTDGATAFFQIHSVLLKTDNANGGGGYYAMRHMENLWWGSSYGLELAWSVGIQEYVHSSSRLDTVSYQDMVGETLEEIIFITDKGYYIFPWSVKFGEVVDPDTYTVAVEGADNDAGSVAITSSGDGLSRFDTWTVLAPDGSVSNDLAVNADKTAIIWDGIAPGGAYTLRLSDAEGTLATYSTAFTLTRVAPVEYDPTTKALVVNADGSAADLAEFIAGITKVAVGTASYGLSGRGAVAVIIAADGSVNGDATFASAGAGTSGSVFANADDYTVTITSTGFKAYTFTYTKE